MVRLAGELAEKAQSLLGGKNLTERRIKSLLEELEQRRALDPTVTDAEIERAREAAEGQEPAAPPRLIEEPDPRLPVSELAPPPASETSAPSFPVGLSPEMQMLFDMVGKLTEQIADLKKPSASDVDKAIGDGKLPPSTVQPPPLGYAGLHQVPVGKWILSPIGPKVNFIICGCGKCTPYRVYHYYCCICKRGPFHYQQRTPYFRKSWMAPGAVWGINHECCSEPCRMSYLSGLGVVAGVNDHEPLGTPSQEVDSPPPPGFERPEPTRPVFAQDSD